MQIFPNKETSLYAVYFGSHALQNCIYIVANIFNILIDARRFSLTTDALGNGKILAQVHNCVGSTAWLDTIP